MNNIVSQDRIVEVEVTLILSEPEYLKLLEQYGRVIISMSVEDKEPIEQHKELG